MAFRTVRGALCERPAQRVTPCLHCWLGLLLPETTRHSADRAGPVGWASAAASQTPMSHPGLANRSG
eukprot:358132-Chlamydomonas_euryale.AAC.3